MAIKLPPNHPQYKWTQDQKPAKPTPRRLRPIGETYVDPWGYVQVVVGSGHPLAKTGSRIAAQHRLVLFNKIGPGTHRCHWCATTITWFVDLQTDHVDFDRSNNAPENLVPSCWPCNRTRHPHQPVPPRTL